ncbi:MAG: hypothetical protein PW786_11755 [Arachidicoccus sp.]|nr:hypothetical protein [Arachidicoccus sp.]
MLISSVLFLKIYWLFPIACAVACWLYIIIAAYFLQRSVSLKKIIGNNIPYITDFISKTLANNKETVIRTVTSEESIDKIMPEIDTYIQEFLTKKVPEQLPMIAMFLGEKTTHQIKEVFIKELRILFPKVISQFIGTAMDDQRLPDILTQKIAESTDSLSDVKISKALSPALLKAKIYAFVFGLLFGALFSLSLFVFA